VPKKPLLSAFSAQELPSLTKPLLGDIMDKDSVWASWLAQTTEIPTKKEKNNEKVR
jgi:hypothetical protein